MPRIGPLGDAAIVVELGWTIDPLVNAQVHALDRAVAGAQLPGVRENVPTYRSLLVHYDPLVTGYADLARELAALAADVLARPAPEATEAIDEKPLVIPVAYGGGYGPDLRDVARQAGLDEAEVIRRHAAGDYRVAMLGFAPGFPYLMRMDPAIACPRLATPRIRVPAGSVAIADAQTGIYPYAMPGGWRLIGRTGLRLFDPDRDPPATLRPGQRVRFVPSTDPADEPDGTEHKTARPREIDAQPSGASPAFRVIEAGFLTTVQDLGRSGFQRYGVPPSGAADGGSLALGNLVLGNPRDAAALEITAGGVEIEFLAAMGFALAGAEVTATLTGKPIRMLVSTEARPGDRLVVGRPSNGIRTYLCVLGGVEVPVVLGSRSTYLPGGIGGFDGRALRAGDVLPAGAPPFDRPGRPADPQIASASAIGGSMELPFVPGGQWHDFPERARQAFVGGCWTVSHQSDRIGLRFDGEPLGSPGAAEFVSDGTVTGAIQIAGDGLPIVLLVDRQTTGGYPKLGAVASLALHRLGQARAGDEIAFRAVSVEEAQAELRAMRPQGPPTSS